MNLLRHFFTQNNSEIGIWKITETCEELTNQIQLNHYDQQRYDSFKNINRKKEFIATRILANKMTKKNLTIKYKDNGKPVIAGENQQISITHSKGCVAIMLNSSYQIGIDIEQIGNRVEKVTKRFLDPEELNYLNQKNKKLQLHYYWSAKEAIYKICSQPLCLKQNIHIIPFVINADDHFFAEMKRNNQNIKLTVYYQIVENNVLTWTETQHKF